MAEPEDAQLGLVVAPADGLSTAGGGNAASSGRSQPRGQRLVAHLRADPADQRLQPLQDRLLRLSGRLTLAEVVPLGEYNRDKVAAALGSYARGQPSFSCRMQVVSFLTQLGSSPDLAAFLTDLVSGAVLDEAR